MLLLSDRGRLYTFTHSFSHIITVNIYHVKCIFDSQITNFNFLGSLEILVDLRACLWKQVSQCLENKGGKCSDRGSGSPMTVVTGTDRLLTHLCVPRRPLSRGEGPEGAGSAITLDSWTVCRSNHQLLVDQGLVGLSLGLVIPDGFFKTYQPILPSFLLNHLHHLHFTGYHHLWGSKFWVKQMLILLSWKGKHAYAQGCPEACQGPPELWKVRLLFLSVRPARVLLSSDLWGLWEMLSLSSRMRCFLLF